MASRRSHGARWRGEVFIERSSYQKGFPGCLWGRMACGQAILHSPGRNPPRRVPVSSRHVGAPVGPGAAVPATPINDIVNEKRGITADTALRLSRCFGTTPRFSMNMQASWELEVADDRLGNAVRREGAAQDRVSVQSPDTSGPAGHSRSLSTDMADFGCQPDMFVR